jgi:hypothetical protein
MKLDATVTRGSESWQFFAFVFAAVLTLALSVLDEFQSFHSQCLWMRVGIKALMFIVCFYTFMLNRFVRNKLVGLLGWLKVEK